MALARGRVPSFIDLTESNPTRAGFAYPPGLLASLTSEQGLTYEPAPLGLPAARGAVAADYGRRGVSISADRVVITASTSEAFSLLFKLLCDPGDCVLVPRPSYPLFEHLTRLEGVECGPYELDYHGTWHINLDSMARAVTARTRAVLLVSPNNPTGSIAKGEELSAIGDLCGARGLALIGDEVFADYPLHEHLEAGPSVLSRPKALTFGLGGLSKTVGLPQLKLGWIGVAGPDDLVHAALDRLAVICDAYLSVSSPVQVATPRLLTEGASVREQIAARVGANYRHLREALRTHPACTLLDAEAGWSAVIQVPATIGEEALVLDLLERRGVLVHPGYFFDFPREAFLVVSLLPRASDFQVGLDRVLPYVEEIGRDGSPRVL
jgi:aspartate/methionine/tyrosine aminotransferase